MPASSTHSVAVWDIKDPAYSRKNGDSAASSTDSRPTNSPKKRRPMADTSRRDTAPSTGFTAQVRFRADAGARSREKPGGYLAKRQPSSWTTNGAKNASGWGGMGARSAPPANTLA